MQSVIMDENYQFYPIWFGEVTDSEGYIHCVYLSRTLLNKMPSSRFVLDLPKIRVVMAGELLKQTAKVVV